MRTPRCIGALFILSIGVLTAGGQEPGELPRVGVTYPEGIVFDVAFSKDGKTLAIACEDKAVRLYEWPSRKLKATFKDHQERVWCAAFSPDGKTLATCTGEYRRPEDQGHIHLWELATGKQLATLTGHKGLIFHVNFDPAGTLLLSGGWDGTARLWSVADHKEVAVLEGHQGPVRRVGWSPKAEHIVTASFDGTVRLWDAKTAKEVRLIKADERGVQTAIFTPDGKTLITASRPTVGDAPGSITRWDAASGMELGKIEGFTSRVLSLALSPDGGTLAVGGGWLDQQTELKLFDLISGKEKAALLGHREWIEAVAFSADGNTLVSGGGFTVGKEGELRFWDLPRLLSGK